MGKISIARQSVGIGNYMNVQVKPYDVVISDLIRNLR